MAVAVPLIGILMMADEPSLYSRRYTMLYPPLIAACISSALPSLYFRMRWPTSIHVSLLQIDAIQASASSSSFCQTKSSLSIVWNLSLGGIADTLSGRDHCSRFYVLTQYSSCGVDSCV